MVSVANTASNIIIAPIATAVCPRVNCTIQSLGWLNKSVVLHTAAVVFCDLYTVVSNSTVHKIAI